MCICIGKAKVRKRRCICIHIYRPLECTVTLSGIFIYTSHRCACVCILLRREHLLTCGVDSGLAILNSDRLACFFADEASSRVQYPTNFALNYCLFKIHTTENPRWRMSVRRKLCVRPPLSLVNAPFRASTTTSLGSRALSDF